MHDFTIDKGFSDITVMYCKKCGKSYALIRYSGAINVSPRTAWEEMVFEDSGGAPVAAPKSCDEDAGGAER